MAPPSSAADSPAHPRRRNSTTIVVPTALKPRHFSDTFELISLRDVISSPAINSPTASLGACASPAATTPGSQSISIRNHLVKQAAWAYLQPMAASPSAGGPPLLSRLWNAVVFYAGDIRRRVAGAVDSVLRALRFNTHR